MNTICKDCIYNTKEKCNHPSIKNVPEELKEILRMKQDTVLSHFEQSCHLKEIEKIIN